VLSRLRNLASNGPVILTLGVVVGLIVPPLADALRLLLTPCVFIFVAGTFLRLDGGAVLAALRNPWYAVWLPAVAVVLLPGLAGSVAAAGGWSGALMTAVLLGLIAPPSSGNAAIARMLGIDASIPFVVTTVAMVATPVTAPLVLAAVGSDVPGLPPLALALRLFLLLAAAGALALGLRRLAPGFVAERGHIFDHLVVGALFVFAIGTMSGVPKLFATDPALVATIVVVAYLANVLLLAGFALATPGPPTVRLAVGITMGNRNVGLIWAVLGSSIDPVVALYFAAAQFPIFTTPLLIRALRRAEPA
jgi:bile acid:Na+ symporter, BASS family